MVYTDAIITLGGGVTDQGALPDVPRRRVELAVTLFRRGVAPRIIFSGWYGLMLEQVPARSEAAAMAEYARGLGVSSNAIFIEDRSRDTIGNAHFLWQQFLEVNAWTKLRVVTSDFHVPRASWIFAKILGPRYEVAFSPLMSGLSPSDLAAQSREEVAITAFLTTWLGNIPDGDHEAIRRLIRKEHPGYAKKPTLTIQDMQSRLEHFRQQVC
jgi:uncharacterized SAM-binding protein YcdF (DUF218 family)